MGTRPGEASDEANKATAKKRIEVTEELRERQDRLTGATAALIVAVREAGEGLWEVGSGLMEEALLRGLEEEGDRMEALKGSLDQKQRELARLASWGQGCVQWRDSILRTEMSHGGVQFTSLEQGSIGKGSEEHGAYGSMILPDPKEASGTLAIKHHCTSEGHQFKNSTSWDVSLSFRASDTGAGKISNRQQPERPSRQTARDKSV